MKDHYIFLPILVQMALTLWLYISLSVAKLRAMKSGEVDEARRALHSDAWPESVLKINNCIRNQFEVPVLFYVLIGTLWNIGVINIYVHIAAWAFVFSRIFHAVIHTGSNYVPLRRKVFMLGCVIVLGLMLFTAYKIISL